ncbi:voltage-dependent T-type calcium channel subunit alpha-1I-like [Pseudoliparis swirei]|uniref:voltage-dependent T-type calcium channel subunit alpha-1I-like n=1 Tax=Pseudoliparis swirei TaxID=2059687 RepID=UPI0024BE85DA|nr:voltage-dependent T-type calcium channel subunit alpha-1I-like [Pseudoliparis swirei]
MDISSSVTPELTGALLRTKTLSLQQLVDAVGPTLSDPPALGSLLGMHSDRVASRLLELWRQRLTGLERSLNDYSQQRAEPDPADPFPDISLSPELGGLTGPLLRTSHPETFTSLETTLKFCNYFFTSTFVIEASLKLVAFGFRRFFKDRWNQLDLAIVLLSVMGITLEEIEINASLPINPTIIRIMRVLRIARVLKLLKMATGMRALLDTVVQALPQVGNLGLLFMLLFFIYAALGVELFGELVCTADSPCEGMSRHATFENFGMAFLTLFQVSTGDNWNGIMKDTLRDCPRGHPASDPGCHAGLQLVSPLYFVSFVLTAQFVLINVVVAVLMKHLDDSNKEAQEDAEIQLELAQGGLCCAAGGGGVAVTAAAAGGPSVMAPLRDIGGAGGGAAHNGHAHHRCRLYSPAQESRWLDSVSLLIKDSLEGDMIDNLSGSVFHHYCSPPPLCRDCKGHTQIQLAEVELASLMSEPLSDKSSSPALPDDLSLDEHASYQLLRSSGDSHSSEEVGVSRRLRPSSSGSEEVVQDPEDPALCSGGSGSWSRPPRPPRPPASWACLRSPSRTPTPQQPSPSGSSLASGISAGSLHPTVEDLPAPLPPSGDRDHLLLQRHGAFPLRATRGRQRSRSSVGPPDSGLRTLHGEHSPEPACSRSLTSLLAPRCSGDVSDLWTEGREEEEEEEEEEDISGCRKDR